jgi:hypothetical protein
VAICPEVLNEAEHALGNLFQRLHHITRVAREGLGANAERMTGALSDLQELLDLVFDYVTPLTLDARPIGCDRLAESVAANVRPFVVQQITTASAPQANVDIDTRVLGRSLQVLAKARARELAAAQAVSVTAAHDPAGTTVEVAVALQGGHAAEPANDVDLAWEVASRLIELQGGELRQSANGTTLTICLSFPVTG